MSDYFYGWYFRCQGKNGSAAVIPAVHLSSEKRACSIQVITQRGSLYREFPISDFQINRKEGKMQIGKNLFSRKGIRLNFEADLPEEISDMEQDSDDVKADDRKVMVRGNLRFGKFIQPKYDIMGPFRFISGMQCRHAVYSMKHSVNGGLKVGREKICFQDAMGYMEGDSGTSFPEKYVWTQHFLSGGSIMLAVATIPLAGLHFTGIISCVLKGNKEYRFATYLGAFVKNLSERELLICQGHYRLYVRFVESEGSMLKAPDNGQMIRGIRENIAGVAEYKLTCRNRVLLHEVTDKAAAEYVY